MPRFTTKDGTEIYYKDWGAGQPVVFSHGWPLSADAWDAQMVFLASRGYRAIAHDRRGHGRSGQPWNGNDMDTYADDLATLTRKLDLKHAEQFGGVLGEVGDDEVGAGAADAEVRDSRMARSGRASLSGRRPGAWSTRRRPGRRRWARRSARGRRG
jgi:hypothetical protein